MIGLRMRQFVRKLENIDILHVPVVSNNLTWWFAKDDRTMQHQNANLRVELLRLPISKMILTRTTQSLVITCTCLEVYKAIFYLLSGHISLESHCNLNYETKRNVIYERHIWSAVNRTVHENVHSFVCKVAHRTDFAWHAFDSKRKSLKDIYISFHYTISTGHIFCWKKKILKNQLHRIEAKSQTITLAYALKAKVHKFRAALHSSRADDIQTASICTEEDVEEEGKIRVKKSSDRIKYGCCLRNRWWWDVTA